MVRQCVCLWLCLPSRSTHGAWWGSVSDPYRLRNSGQFLDDRRRIFDKLFHYNCNHLFARITSIFIPLLFIFSNTKTRPQKPWWTTPWRGSPFFYSVANIFAYTLIAISIWLCRDGVFIVSINLGTNIGGRYFWRLTSRRLNEHEHFTLNQHIHKRAYIYTNTRSPTHISVGRYL